jgi:hypothetical protein
MVEYMFVFVRMVTAPMLIPDVHRDKLLADRTGKGFSMFKTETIMCHRSGKAYQFGAMPRM